MNPNKSGKLFPTLSIAPKDTLVRMGEVGPFRKHLTHCQICHLPFAVFDCICQIGRATYNFKDIYAIITTYIYRVPIFTGCLKIQIVCYSLFYSILTVDRRKVKVYP